jgi:hypothetical protein
MNKRISLHSSNWLLKDFYGETGAVRICLEISRLVSETLAEVTARALANRTSSNEHWSI